MKQPLVRLAKGLAVGVALTVMLTLVVAPRRAQAQAELTQFHAFGAVGLTRGFTLVLTVMNLQDNFGVPRDPCTVEMVFKVPPPFTPRDPVEPTVLEPREQVTTRLNGDHLLRETARAGARVEVGALVRVTGTAVPPEPCVSSLQLVANDTGITTAVEQPRIYY
jgi:hypothetical protein